MSAWPSVVVSCEQAQQLLDMLAFTPATEPGDVLQRCRRDPMRLQLDGLPWLLDGSRVAGAMPDLVVSCPPDGGQLDVVGYDPQATITAAGPGGLLLQSAGSRPRSRGCRHIHTDDPSALTDVFL